MISEWIKGRLSAVKYSLVMPFKKIHGTLSYAALTLQTKSMQRQLSLQWVQSKYFSTAAVR